MVASILSETNLTTLPRQSQMPCKGRKTRLHFEALESRTLLSATLFVTAPGVPVDSTHFQTLQAALLAAGNGDTIDMQAGFDAGVFVTTALTQAAAAGSTSLRTAAALGVGEVVTIGGVGGDPLERALVMGVTATGTGDFQIALATPLKFGHTGSVVDAMNGAMGPTVGIAVGVTVTADAGVSMPFNLEVWQTAASSQTVLSSLDLGGHALLVDGGGTHINMCTLAAVTVQAGAQGNAFFANTFNVTGASGLAIDGGDNTTIDANTFHMSAAGSTAIVVHNSGNVLITNNMITAGPGGKGIAVMADGVGTSTANIRGNTVQSLGGGTGIYLAKLSSGATLQAQVQGNDLRTNIMGVVVQGDGASAGNVDLGGGSTVFGSSTGGNNFSSIAFSDATHFAIGMFGTGPAAFVRASGNTFLGFNPLNVVADGLHDADAGGSGVILASGTFVMEFLNATMGALVPVNGAVSGTVASFTSNLSHISSDFNAVIDWGDGTTSVGAISDNGLGGFAIGGNHTWTGSGTFNVTVLIVSLTGGNTLTAGTALVQAPRTLSMLGGSTSVDQNATLTAAVATFTDSKGTATPADYVVSILWSDGTSSAGSVTQNSDGSFSVNTSRTFAQAGTATAGITVTTTDGKATAGCTFTVTVNAPAPARSITLDGVDITSDRRNAFSGVVARFSDSQGGTTAGSYVASIAWSDGQTTAGVITKNSDGSFSISTSRSFSRAGIMVASVAVGTIDGSYSATGNFTATITNSNDHLPHRCLHWVMRMVHRYEVRHFKTASPHGNCGRG